MFLRSIWLENLLPTLYSDVVSVFEVEVCFLFQWKDGDSWARGKPLPLPWHSQALEAEEPSLGWGWLFAQHTQPQRNPLLFRVLHPKDQRGPSLASPRARPTASQRQGISKCGHGCHASPPGVTGVFGVCGEWLQSSLPEDLEWWGRKRHHHCSENRSSRRPSTA